MNKQIISDKDNENIKLKNYKDDYLSDQINKKNNEIKKLLNENAKLKENRKKIY